MKKFLVSLLCIAMVLSLMPTMVFAGNTAADSLPTEVNGTITLTQDVNLKETAVIEQDVTIDLAGYNITADGFRAIHVKSGKLVLKGEGTITSTGSIEESSSVIRVGDQEDASLEIGEKVTIDGPASYGVTAFGSGKESVTVNGMIKGKTGALSGNGNDQDEDSATNFVINSTAKLSSESVAVYHPQNGTFAINGGTIYGKLGGIEIKSGLLNISGNPSITTDSQKSNDPNSNGTSTTGYAIAVVKNEDYAGNPEVIIDGGTFQGAMGVVDDDKDAEVVDPQSITVNGGAFTDLTGVVNYVANEKTISLAKDVTDGSGVVVPGGKNFTLDFAGHTYTVTHDLAGSAGTESQCFQLLEGSTLLFKNGTIKANNDRVAMLIQNYSNLTLENMVLDGRTMTRNGTYTLSNNNGDTKLTGNTSVFAKEGDVAFDVCWAKGAGYEDGARVTVDTTGTIKGTVELGIWGSAPSEQDDKSRLEVKKGIIDGVISVNDQFADYATKKVSVSGGTLNYGDGSVLNYISETASGVKINLPKDQEITITSVNAGKVTFVAPAGTTVKNQSGADIVMETPNGTITVKSGETEVSKPYEPPYIPPADPLATERATANQMLSQYLDITKYDTAEQAVIKDILAQAKTDIEKADSKVVIDTIVASAKIKLDEVLTTEEKELQAAEAEKNARLKAGVKATTIKLKSTLDRGKVKLNWSKSEGYKVDYYEVYRSTKRYEGYGTKPFFETKQGGLTGWYRNTAVKKGTRYYYKVRGTREIAGETVYTQYSNKAWRMVK